ncbi:MAG: FAD-dependent oxidoreductase [Limisphaerales bacterium]
MKLGFLISLSRWNAPNLLGVFSTLLFTLTSPALAGELLVEAESFQNPGGWVLDTQFIESMGSPYLMAHGLGEPVKDATTTVRLPQTGNWRVWVRTMDWVARWKTPGAPGRFQVLVNGTPLKETFGTLGADWAWHDGGTVNLAKPEATLALHDLTGFNGRCDAILLTTDPVFRPSNDSAPLAPWRMALAGLPPKPEEAGSFDLVVVGGGYGGMGAALAAARMGCKVALVQNRPVLGGNGSSEIRVWAKGGIRRGQYPMLGEIVEEFMDRAKASPGTFEEFGDAKKEALVRAEPKISLFLNHHAFRVEVDGSRIKSITAFDTRTGHIRRFAGTLFVDSTGHAGIGALAGADHTTKDDGHLGMSNMWRWGDAGKPVSFPNTPWALDLTMDDFPYPRRGHGEWFWESGFNKHPLLELESTRDWNFRAIFGAFNAMKNKDGRAEHPNAKLEWIAYVGGTRESRQLLGDVVLTREDIVAKKMFPDGTVPTTWDIDLHYPKEQYAKKFPEDPFISKAVFGQGVDRQHGYPVPYRCFYSRNIENLFMAGRNVSVTHEALGTVRVMKTGGMIGEVVGKAASLCIKHATTPRAIYHSHFEELQALLKLPGAARRENVNDTPKLPADYKPLPPQVIVAGDAAEPGIDVKTLPGLVLDDAQARLTGKWITGANPELQPYVANGYRYRNAKEEGTARYEFTIQKAGDYEVRVSYSPHENRASNAPVIIESADGVKETTVNQRVKPPLPQNFISLGVFKFAPGKPAVVTLGGKPADGNVHADAVQLLPK